VTGLDPHVRVRRPGAESGGAAQKEKLGDLKHSVTGAAVGRLWDEAQMGDWGEVGRKSYEYGKVWDKRREGERPETPGKQTANRKPKQR